MQVNKNCTQLLVGLSKHVEHNSIVWTMPSYPPNESTVCIIHFLKHFYLLPEKLLEAWKTYLNRFQDKR